MHGRKNIVAWNEIHDVMQTLGDGNGIYISGTGKENHIYQNYIHHLDGDGVASGIRCDNDQYETIVDGNVLYKIRTPNQEFRRQKRTTSSTTSLSTLSRAAGRSQNPTSSTGTSRYRIRHGLLKGPGSCTTSSGHRERTIGPSSSTRVLPRVREIG